MSEHNVRKVAGHGNLGVHGDRVRYDVEMEVQGQVAGSVPIFVDIDKHFSKEDAAHLRRILTDGRQRAVAAVYPAAAPPEVRPPTGGQPARSRPKRLGLRFMKPLPGEAEAAARAKKEGRDLPARAQHKRPVFQAPPAAAEARKMVVREDPESDAAPKDDGADLPTRASKKPYVAPKVDPVESTDAAPAKTEIDTEAPTLRERPEKGDRE